jgi:SNF2 family DNA or RNA helicase
VTGDVTGSKRQAFVDDFNEGRIQILLITLGAGGEGLSLVGSSTEIFLQRSFSAIKNSQGEDRLHGIGRGEEGKALNIIDIVTPDTIEQHVFEIMQEKARKLEEVVRDADTLKKWLSKPKKGGEK